MRVGQNITTTAGMNISASAGMNYTQIVGVNFVSTVAGNANHFISGTLTELIEGDVHNEVMKGKTKNDIRFHINKNNEIEVFLNDEPLEVESTRVYKSDLNFEI